MWTKNDFKAERKYATLRKLDSKVYLCSLSKDQKMAQGKRPKWRILSVDISVKFETYLQQKGQLRFSIPKEVARLLGIEKSKRKLHLRIEKLSGDSVYEGKKLLTSGTEITGANMKSSGLRAGAKIKVQVSRPR